METGLIASTVKWQLQIISMKLSLLTGLLQGQLVDSGMVIKKMAGDEFVSRRVFLTGLQGYSKNRVHKPSRLLTSSAYQSRSLRLRRVE